MEEWIKKVGDYVALDNKDALLQAADLVGDDEIASFIRTIHKDPSFKNHDRGLPFAEKIRNEGRETEADVVELLVRSKLAKSAQSPERFKPEEKKEMVKWTLIARERCIKLSERLGLPACVALFIAILGTGLTKSHIWDGAQKAFEDARDIYRELVEKEPYIYRPYVAMTLNNLGLVLSEQHDFPRAQVAYEEALKIRRELAKEEPHIYRPDVAMTLNNLGVVLSEQRDFPGAKEAYKDALKKYRELAKKEPHIYRPYVATTLNNLGVVLRNQRDFPRAQEMYEEALEIRRELAEDGPRIYLPDVAMTLSNLGNVLREQRDFPGAKKAYEEALEKYRELAKEEPHIYRPDVAMTLNNLGNVLDDQRDFPGAEKAFEEARDIYSELAKEEPRIYLPDVAMTLNNLGNVLGEQRDFPGAKKAFEEALKKYRELVEREPHIYRPYVATILNNLGVVLGDQRDFLRAKEAYKDALEKYRELAKEKPRVYLPYVAGALHNLGSVLGEQRDFPGAKKACEETLKIRRELAKKEPHIYLPDVATTLNNLGNVLGNQRDFPGAKKAFEEALEIRRKLAEKEPYIYLPGVAMTLNNLGNVFRLREQRDFLRAKEAYGEARDIFRERLDPPDWLEASKATGNLMLIPSEEFVGGAAERTALAYEGIEELRRGFKQKEGKITDSEKYLFKQRVMPCIEVVLKDLVSKKKPDKDKILSHWIALRDGAYLPPKDTGQFEKDRKHFSNMLQEAGGVVNKRLSILLVERLYDNTLIGLLDGDKDGTFHYELCPDFHESAGELFKKLDEWQRKLCSHFANEEIKELRKIVTRIQALSRQCWDALPKFAKEALRPPDPSGPSDDFVLLSCDDAYAHFPFEILAYSNETDIDAPAHYFLGLRRVLPRIPALFDSLERLRDREIGNGSKTAMVFADPTGDLKGACLEGEFLDMLLRESLGYRMVPENRALIGNEATREKFIDGLKNHKPAIVHYTGHGGMDKRFKECIVFFDRPFYTEDLRVNSIEFDNNPLFILNGCRLGRIESFGTVREDLSGELIRSGAEAVVASPFILYTGSDLLFTREFYGGKAAGRNIGERVIQARRAVYDDVETKKSSNGPSVTWPVWALHVLHGNPFARAALGRS